MSADPLIAGEPLGRGLTADVYAWGADRVVKLYHQPDARERAECELKITRAVHASGLPAPAAYDVVEIGGRCGLVLERIDGPSLLARVQRRPWTMGAAVRELAELQTQVHRHAAPPELPPQHERVRQRIEAAENLCDAGRQQALAALSDLPGGEAVCHGDFHPENVLFTARGPIVIDWSAATRGPPASDIACTSLLMQHAHLPAQTPGFLHALLACFRGALHRHYLSSAVRFGSATRSEIIAWEGVLRFANLGVPRS